MMPSKASSASPFRVEDVQAFVKRVDNCQGVRRIELSSGSVQQFELLQQAALHHAVSNERISGGTPSTFIDSPGG